MVETWKDIENYEGIYKISNLGRVSSLERKTYMKDGRIRTEHTKILKPIKDKHGYFKVRLYNSNGNQEFKIHVLVAHHFISSRPDNKVINHIDENKANNSVTNLEYITQKENINHGTGNIRRKNQPHALKVKAVRGKEVYCFNSITEASKILKLNIGHISACVNNKRKSHGGFKFEII